MLFLITVTMVTVNINKQRETNGENEYKLIKGKK